MSSRSAADRQVERDEGPVGHGVGNNDTFGEAEITNLLSHVVEGEIIPRLMLAYKSSANPNPEMAGKIALSDAVVRTFANMTLEGEVDDLESYVVRLGGRGLPTESLYIDLLAPAARLLGQYWENDDCSFTEVTVGLGRLQTLLYRLSARQTGIEDPDELTLKGLFITPAGGQHNLGIRMVEDLFARAGWQTVCEPGISKPDLLQMLANENFDLVGLGISVVEQIEPAKGTIQLIRKNAQNKDVKVIVGGSLLIREPDLGAYLEADFTAKDAREAVTIAQNLIYDARLRHRI